MAILSRTPSVYQIRHIESGRVYVGSAVDPRKRWNEHLKQLHKGTHHSQYLQRAWEKHGESAFAFEIIEPVLFVEDLIAREQYWIDTLHASDPVHGYNTSPTAGSPLGVKRTAKQRAKTAEIVKAQLADPARRAKFTADSAAYWADPVNRAAAAERARAQFADPDQRAAASARARAQLASPAARAAHAARAKTIHSDPARRAAAAERTNAQFADPAARERAAENTRAQFADPTNRAKLKAYWADPANRQRAAEKSKALWADPEWRAKRKKRGEES